MGSCQPILLLEIYLLFCLDVPQTTTLGAQILAMWINFIMHLEQHGIQKHISWVFY